MGMSREVFGLTTTIGVSRKIQAELQFLNFTQHGNIVTARAQTMLARLARSGECSTFLS